MTVASTVRRNVYNYIAGQTVFPFTFPVLEKSHVEVYVLPTGQTVPTQLVNGVDYTVFGEGNDAGGNVTLTVATTGTGTITLLREVPYTQPTDFKNQGSFFPRTHERAFDRVTMLAQQIAETLGRSLTLPIDATGVNTELPYPTAGNLIGWDSSTLNIRNFSPAEIATTVAFGNFRYDRFTATVGQTAFTLAADPGALGNLDVSIDGVTQVPIDDYTLAGTTITLTSAMAGGERVLARYGTAAGATDANGMTWQPPGVGAVQRTVQDGLRDVVSVNVKNYGAIGDDVANDRAAIQAAIDYAASLPNGGEVFFPAGVYRMNAAVNVPNSKSLILRGEGDGAKLRLFSGAGGQILNCGSASIFSTRLVIKSLFFQGPSGGTSKGITLLNCNTARIEDCVFQNQTVGVESASSFAIELTGNVFDVCSLYGFIATTACHNAIIERNNFFTCQTQAVRFDVLSDNLVIDNNNFEFCGSNILLNNCTAVSIRGNYIEYQSNACFEFIGTCRNVSIEHNWIALGTGGGAIAALQNIVGGGFRLNTIFDQTVTTAATLVDFEIGANYKYGTGTMAVQNWIAPALLNSWANQANYNPAGYRKDENNIVHLRGNLISGTVGTVAFNLPAGYRPANFGTYGSAGTSGVAACEIRPNGDVFISVAPSNQAGLNGISFKAEA